jgi:cobalt-zinc-cadmium efflux system membrane fusion protein
MFVLLVAQASCKKIESETADIEEHEHKHTEHEPKHTEHEPKHTEHEHGHDDHEEISEIEIDNERLELIGLKTEKIEHKVVSQHINATAEIQFNANRLFRVSPRIQSRVIEILADFGDEVIEGQKLAVLDSIELGEARSLFLRAKTKVEVAQANYEREKGLWEKGISSEKEMLDAKGEYFIAKAEFEAAENKLHLLGLSEDDIQSTVSQLHSHEHFPLLSPYKGTVIEKHITLGEMTDPEKTLFTIANLDILWIILDIYEKDLSRIKLSQEVEIYVTAFPDDEFKGHITYISNVVEEATRTVKVRVEIDNSKRMLKPGMFATAKIVTSKPEEIFTIPLSAIQRMEGKEVVFVKKGENLFECCPVKTGREFETDIEILEGVKEGEHVVTEGAFYLKSELLKGTIVDEHIH